MVIKTNPPVRQFLYIYKSPCISFIKSAYASSLVAVSATFGCETCCGTLSSVSGPEAAARSFALLLGWSRLTRNAVGMSFVNSAWVFRNCGLALMVAVASLLIVGPVRKKARRKQLLYKGNNRLDRNSGTALNILIKWESEVV